MPHDPTIALHDILRELAFLEGLVKTHSFESFKADATAYRAAAYSIQTVSEAVRHLPDEWLAEHPELPWAAIRGAGNKIRHEYFRLDDTILWNILIEDGPAMKAAVTGMLARYSA